MQPGEERHAAMLSGFFRARPVHVGATAYEQITADKEETLSYELRAVLFADGTVIGPESIFVDFSHKVTTVRSLARDAQNAAQDKYRLLEQDKQTMPRAILDALGKGAPVRPGTSQDFQKLKLRMQISNAILGIRDKQGEQEAEAALARLAALPDVVKGE